MNDASIDGTPAANAPREHKTKFSCPVGLATRRAHLSQAHLEALFGADPTLTPLLNLPGARITYAEEVVIKGPEGRITCRVVGPAPKHTRIYLRPKEREALGIGDEDAAVLLKDSHGCTLEGPKGMLILAEGLLDVTRTLYLSAADQKSHRLEVGDLVRMQINGDRTRIYSDVLVRSHPEIQADSLPPLVMLDIDEANACEIRPNTKADLCA